jgi:hypothetical protein
MKKTVTRLTLAFLAGVFPASAKQNLDHTADPEFLHVLLQQKLDSGIHGRAIAIDIRHPGRALRNGWHYIDALRCGWYSDGGVTEFYAYDGSFVVWDLGLAPGDAAVLATALAVPCVHGNKLGFHIYDGVHYNKTESFTYP